MSDKVNAAFILFDQNNSGTMSFDELAALIKTVFTLVSDMVKFSAQNGATYKDEIFTELDYPSVAVETAKKAFGDLQVPITSEINYQQFMQWTTGQNMYSEEELVALERTKPASKSKFAQKKFASANEWVKRFLQEAEFVEHLMKLRDNCQL